MDIQQSAVQGEPGTGYENPDGKGPFECGNCEYFKNDYCRQKTMMERSKQPKGNDGRVQVDLHGCCEYIERKGKKDALGTFKQAHDNRRSNDAG